MLFISKISKILLIFSLFFLSFLSIGIYSNTYFPVTKSVFAQDHGGGSYDVDLGNEGESYDSDYGNWGAEGKDGRTEGTSGSANSDDPLYDISAFVGDPPTTPTNPVSYFSIVGRVYIDANRNQDFDPGEVTLDNQLIRLRDGNTHAVISQQTTSGVPSRYNFSNIPGGYYRVSHVTVPVGFVRTTPQAVYLALTGDATIRFGIVHADSPTNFTGNSGCASGTISQNILTWDAPVGNPTVSYYELWRGDITSGPIYSGTALAYQEVTPQIVNTGHTYLYKVRAMVSGSFTAFNSILVDSAICTAPSAFNIYDSTALCIGAVPRLRFDLSRSNGATKYEVYRKVGSSSYVKINDNFAQFLQTFRPYSDSTHNPASPLDPLDITSPIYYYAVAVNENNMLSVNSTYINNPGQINNGPATIKDCNIPTMSLLINNDPNFSTLQNNTRANITWSAAHADTCSSSSTVTSTSGGPTSDSSWNALTSAQLLNTTTGASGIQSLLYANPPTTNTSYTLTCTNNNIVDTTSVASGLVGYWAMDELSWNGTPNELKDKTLNALHGAVSGTSTNSIASGKFGRAANLPGYIDHFVLSNNSRLDVPAGGAFTITGFIQTDENLGCFVSFRNSTNGNPVINLCLGFAGTINAPGKMIAYVRDDTSSAACCAPFWGGVELKTTSTINNSSWRQFALTRSATGKLTLYLDGVSQGVVNYTTGSITTNLRAIGGEKYWYNVGFGTGDEQFFRGQLDEIRFYNRDLSAAELDTIASTTIAVDPSTSQVSGLSLYWPMDEASWNGTSGEVKDITGNSRHGTAVNGADTVQGKYTNAGNFDGVNNYVSGATSPISNGQAARTISAWINPANVNPGGVVFSMNDSSGVGQSFIVMVENFSGTTVLFSDGKNGGNNITISGAEIPPAGVWSHIAFTFDGAGAWKYYLNGALTKSGNFGIPINTATTNIEVGRRGDGVNTGHYFNGRIDDFRIYDRALTTTEVGQIYTPPSISSTLKTQSINRSFLIETLKPFIQTTGGDVHTQGTIDAPGGP